MVGCGTDLETSPDLDSSFGTRALCLQHLDDLVCAELRLDGSTAGSKRRANANCLVELFAHFVHACIHRRIHLPVFARCLLLGSQIELLLHRLLHRGHLMGVWDGARWQNALDLSRCGRSAFLHCLPQIWWYTRKAFLRTFCFNGNTYLLQRDYPSSFAL